MAKAVVTKERGTARVSVKPRVNSVGRWSLKGREGLGRVGPASARWGTRRVRQRRRRANCLGASSLVRSQPSRISLANIFITEIIPCNCHLFSQSRLTTSALPRCLGRSRGRCRVCG